MVGLTLNLFNLSTTTLNIIIYIKYNLILSDEFECEWNGNNRTTTWDYFYGENCVEKECHVFIDLCWSDEVVGGICLTLAFVLMFLSLGGVVKCLKAVLEGSITDMIHKHIDRNLPHPFAKVLKNLCFFHRNLFYKEDKNRHFLNILNPRGKIFGRYELTL